MNTVAERIDQIRKDLKDIAHILIDSDDTDAAIMFLATEESLVRAHRKADWLQDQDWDEYTHRTLESSDLPETVEPKHGQ
jgi:DNA anti-recombination protein RmuC